MSPRFTNPTLPHQFGQDYELQTDVPVPKLKSNEVLIKIAASGFCHTDYQVFEGAYKSALPHIGSHEPTGVIADVGADVQDYEIGDRVGAYLFRNACGQCSDCQWHAAKYDGTFDARYCKQQEIAGIRDADGGFAEYMSTPADALVRIPEAVSFTQAAPLMCAGATVWNALIEADVAEGQTVAIVGIGALGLLAIQFAKARGLRVVAVSSRANNDEQLAKVPKGLGPDLVANYKDEQSVARIAPFTNGIGIDAAVVCTDNIEQNDWIARQLQPKGTCVVLGLPEKGFTFDAFNIVFREIVIKGSLHCSIKDMEDMMVAVERYGVQSNVSVVPLDDAAHLPSKVHAHAYPGKPVVVM